LRLYSAAEAEIVLVCSKILSKNEPRVVIKKCKGKRSDQLVKSWIKRI